MFTPPSRLLGPVLAITTVAGAGTADAITSGGFNYKKPHVGVYTISTADMQPEGTNAHAEAYSRSAIYLTMGTAEQADCMIAGVHVPQDAKLTTVSANFKSGVHYDPVFRVTRVAFNGDFGDIAFFYPKVDNNGVRHTRSAKFLKGKASRVDNTKYMYIFEFCSGLDDVFYGARVYYEYTSAGD